MNEIQNTTEFIKDGGAYLLLAAAMGGASTDELIGDMEARGQRQLVNSSQLPVEVQRPGTDADFEAVGFTFGAPEERDDLFRPAALPPGWTKRGSDHAMWSYIDDELGRERVAIFYKAAFYDRSAFMRLVDVHGYVYGCYHGGKQIVTDGTWATREAVHQAALELAASARERVASWTEIRNRPGQRESSIRSADEYIPECTAEAEKYEAIAAEYAPTDTP